MGKPKECSVSISVFDEFSYEKTLCYIRRDLTNFKASEVCKQRGMQLYVSDSSPASSLALKNFAETTLKGNSKIEVFISGRRPGNKCKTFRGDNSYSSVPCIAASHFICEYKDNRKHYHPSNLRKQMIILFISQSQLLLSVIVIIKTYTF